MLERNIVGDMSQLVVKKLPTYQAEDLTQGGQEAQIVLSEQVYNLPLIPSGVNADTRWGFPKAGKSESMAAYLGERSDGCSNRITVGF